jgi:hypothetical protein
MVRRQSTRSSRLYPALAPRLEGAANLSTFAHLELLVEQRLVTSESEVTFKSLTWRERITRGQSLDPVEESQYPHSPRKSNQASRPISQTPTPTPSPGWTPIVYGTACPDAIAQR